MNSINLLLLDVNHKQQYHDVISFVGEDKSGSFGILPDHERFMTALETGLCRFKSRKDGWLYIATASALLYFHHNRLILTSRHFLIDSNYQRISKALTEQFFVEEARLQGQKQSLRQMQEEMLKRLWDLRRSGVSYSQDEI